MKYLLILVFLIFLNMMVSAQTEMDTLSLEECYEILYSENPVTNKIQLNRQITSLNEKIATSGWYPDLLLSASASYQSDVVEFPFDSPGFSVPSFSKDHYNLTLNITQPIFDGGRANASRKLEEESGDVTKASLESDLLNLKEQVDRIYFGILILEKNNQILELAVSDMRDQLSIVRSQIKNGMRLQSDEATLQAEILKREQELIKIERDLSSGYQVLNEILGFESPLYPLLILPEKENWNRGESIQSRPELELLDAREEMFDAQQDLTEAGKHPQVSLFARPSYGRPGLNIFEDELQFNWIVGIQAKWSFKTARNATIKSEAIQLQRKNLREDRTLFTRQQNMAIHRLEQEIEGLEEQIEKDKEIVELRKQIAEEKKYLVEEGSVVVSDYVRDLNESIRAQLQLELRKIQRVQAIINFETEQGWTWN